MKKQGFTLPEIMVVVAIIAVIAIIAIPSVILINKNINKRLYKNKVDNIVSAAELYASDNPDIFNQSSEVRVYVYELIASNYLESEKQPSTNDDQCKSTDTKNAKGCIINPVAKSNMNNEYVILRKEAAGISGSFGGQEIVSSNNDTLVKAICDRFKDVSGSSIFEGRYGTNDSDKCTCNAAGTGLVKKGTDEAVSACLIYGNQKNNYLSYDGVMWRVMGLYQIDSNRLVAKMITDNNVEIIN